MTHHRPSRTALFIALLLVFLITGRTAAEEPPQTQTHKADPPSFEQSEAHTMTLAELRRKYSDTFKFRGPRTKEVALTFDDVPDPRFTQQILRVLKSKQVHATFFIVGNRARKHPDLVKAIKKNGHAIGNHSYSHPLLKKMSLADFQQQILKTERIVFRLTGIRPKLIRPPYGEINEEQVKWAKQNGYKIVNWNVDSLDWKGIGKEEVKHNVLSQTGPGSIILQHAGGGIGTDLSGTIAALPDIIDELKSRGYQFVTVPELLNTSEGKTTASSIQR
ncbi:polysaccharide deacetylase family protein [Paenibacillus caui]|uniref:polysaccharide deacetylase family protein n=1 Tax=Paenibacillus caui TaxID=2873927 RepID=UPI001CA80AA5|nr:polysaccharide deacetylase family protein [Paenibacillus caui]